MIDQLTIGDKASYDDFGASLAWFNAKPPKKKSIRETIPFFNGSYDFSAINGEVYWEDRVIECIFEMLADTPEELEEKKAAFSSWVMNVMEQNIHSPFIPDYHFVGTYDDMEYEDDEGLDKTTATVTFLAYPYKLALRRYEFDAPWQHTNNFILLNKSNHPVWANVVIESNYTGDSVKINGKRFNTKEGVQEFTMKLPPGIIELSADSEHSNNKITIAFTEEVL